MQAVGIIAEELADAKMEQNGNTLLRQIGDGAFVSAVNPAGVTRTGGTDYVFLPRCRSNCDAIIGRGYVFHVQDAGRRM